MPMLRVRRDWPCPICGRGDWCLRAEDDSACICARVASSLPRSSAGWLHVLADGPRPEWREVRRKPERPVVDWRAHCNAYRRSLTVESLWRLSSMLEVSMESLRFLRVGWCESRYCWTFPMREPNGNPCGVRCRSLTGAKYADLHSREGLFFLPALLTSDYLLICEGPSDTAAMMDLGYVSVIGRASCRGNVEQIENLCRRLNPRSIVIVPDSDEPGVSGATALLAKINQYHRTEMLRLPIGIKDVRECIHETKNADWLRGAIGKLCETLSKQGATSNDNHV